MNNAKAVIRRAKPTSLTLANASILSLNIKPMIPTGIDPTTTSIQYLKSS